MAIAASEILQISNTTALVRSFSTGVRGLGSWNKNGSLSLVNMPQCLKFQHLNSSVLKIITQSSIQLERCVIWRSAGGWA